MTRVTRWLNRITMYRLVLYYLLLLVGAALVLSALKVLSFDPVHIAFTAVLLAGLCIGFNQLFARIFNCKTNPESQLISALIITLIVGPFDPWLNLQFIISLAAIAMGSKYILAWHGRHAYNPAAVAVFLTAVLIGKGASWWVGNVYLFPLVLIGGVLIVQKIQRWNMVLGFLGLYLAATIAHVTLNSVGAPNILALLVDYISLTPILFFATVMLVEPITGPNSPKLRLWYGLGVAAILFVYQTTSAAPYTLELSLLTANLIIFLIRHEKRNTLVLQEKVELAHTVFGFWFKPSVPLVYKAGQFLEWTLPHAKPDSRGVRRYFTIASSPTEKDILLVTKFAPRKGSSFKDALSHLPAGESLYADGLEGDFVLPSDTTVPLVFIAGGIGVTPFRSMIKYLIDTNEHRNITLLYSVRSESELVFRDVFDNAKQVGVISKYIITGTSASSINNNETITPALIKECVKDVKTPLYYVSGPELMVKAFYTMLIKMGISPKSIKHDYFPGYESLQ